MKNSLFLLVLFSILYSQTLYAQYGETNPQSHYPDYDASNQHLKKGLDLMDANNYKQAAVEFEISLKYWDKNKIAIVDLGKSYYELGLFNKAIDILKIDPTGSAITNLIGKCYFSIPKYDSALVYFRNTLNRTPDDAEAYYWIASVYFKLNNQKEMIINLQKAAHLGDKDAQKTLKDAGYGWD